MNSLNFKVIRRNGETLDMEEIGIKVLSFTVSAPEVRHEFEEVVGRDGVVDMGTNYGTRLIEARCVMVARDIYDYPLLRNKLFRIFDSREAFYIINDAEPGKRWLVKYAGPFSLKQTNVIGEFTIQFVSLYPYAESVATTQDPLTFESEMWQFGQGIPLEDIQYDHDQKRFRIYNAGDVTVDPREHPLHIVIHTEAADLTTLELFNHTTGDYFFYEGNTYSDVPIELIGVQALRGESRISLSRRTNLGLITLSPGWNEMEVKGDHFRRITFKFRFYYL